MPFFPPYTTRRTQRAVRRPTAAASAEKSNIATSEEVVAEVPEPKPISPPAGAPEAALIPNPVVPPVVESAVEKRGDFPNWSARMRKAELLDIVAQAGIKGLSMNNTKDEIMDALIKAEDSA